MLMTKNGERNCYFAYHSSKMQDVSRDTRRAIRETDELRRSCVLTDRKTRQLTGVSRKISPVRRVDTGGNSHLRGDHDHVRVHAKHKGRTTGCADHETTEGFSAEFPQLAFLKGEGTSGSILASRLVTYGTNVAKSWSHEARVTKILDWQRRTRSEG